MNKSRSSTDLETATAIVKDDLIPIIEINCAITKFNYVFANG